MLTFEDSKERCKDVGGELAAPLTEIEIRDWLIVIHINYVVYNYKINFGLQRTLWLMCKVCYMQTVDISEIYPQQAHQA